MQKAFHRCLSGFSMLPPRFHPRRVREVSEVRHATTTPPLLASIIVLSSIRLRNDAWIPEWRL